MKIKYKNNLYQLSQSQNGQARINDEDISFASEQLSAESYFIEIAGERKQVYVTEAKSNIYVGIDGEQYIFTHFEDDDYSLATAGNENRNTESIYPPMPGNIVKILVSVGDEVEEGTGLIVVEAMKMETTLYASIPGKVSKILVSESTQVEADTELIRIEK